MNRDQKTTAIEQIATDIQESDAVFAVDYRGLSVTQAAELRGRLREADARFRVVKNTLTERAAERAGVEPLKALLDGPTALTFVRGDAAVAAKAIADYARATDGLLPFKGGLLGEEALDADGLRALSRLPSREVLHGQLVGIIASPVSGLVRTLNALVSGLVQQLRQIAEQSLVAGETPAASASDQTSEADPDNESPEPAPVQPDPPEGADEEAQTGAPEGADVPPPGQGDPSASSQETEEVSSQTDDSEAQAPQKAAGTEQDKE